ncbi:MAG: hypothetical protein NC205_03260 [Prevotella sp.]|nr:hypothetical protein [Alistipes senegalensis]MCM1357586.1 hypothetical protein [Prevotella sp.]MCM1473757.1 hypothetical protein [Muribaculaceae bacterium]
MKRLKYRHIFLGQSIPIIFSMFVACFVIIAISYIVLKSMEDGFMYLSVVSIAIILLTLVVDYVIIHHLTPDEKKKIAGASPPEWKKLPDRMKDEFQTDKKLFLISSAIVIGFELIFAFFVMLSKGVETMFVTLAVILPVTLICLAIYAIWEHIWGNMDDSAIYTKIEVDHAFEGERLRFGGRRKFIVFYLPHGKYVLETDDYFIPRNIVVIKYKCFIRWEDANKFI